MSFLSRSISNRAFSAWSLVTAVEGLLVTYFLASESSETEHVFAFGISAQLLLIVIGVFLAALFFLGLSIVHFYRLVSWNEFLNTRPKLVQHIFLGVFILEIALLQIWFLIPDYYFPILSGYLSRLRPMLIWLILLFGQTFIFLAYFQRLSLESLKGWRKNIPIIVALVTVMMTWGIIAITEIGITPDAYYWNMAGVPLLAGQVWATVGVTLVSWLLYNQFVVREKKLSKASTPMIFIGIWIVAALIWVRAPLAPNFNAPGPYLPTKGFYPFVDAASYDLGAQSAIYGKGINFGSFIDRGLLMGFLAFLHMLFGQSYLVIVGVQSALFASFPALLYLLGKKLHSESVGFMAATFAVFKVLNAIVGGKWFSTAHPKLMMTEFPTGIVLVLFSLFLVQWLKRSESRSYMLGSIGAALGIGILLRQNVFFMFPVVFSFGIVAVWKRDWKRALRDTFLIVAAFFVTISPWMWRNQHVAGEPLFFLPHFNRVIEERYQPQSQIDHEEPISTHFSMTAGIRARAANMQDENILDQYQFIPKHFVHNLITSVLILPPSPVLDDLRHVVDSYPYWGRTTDSSPGQLLDFTGMFLAANLIILSIGLGNAWKRIGFISLVPLAVFLFYNLANAFARTSGGRYIVPVDWVVYFYYAIGLVEIIRFCVSLIGFRTNDFFGRKLGYEHNDVRRLNWSKTGLVILPFFLMVASLPLIELTSPGNKPPETTDALMQQLDKTSLFDKPGLSRLEIEEFLKNPAALLISGRGFYPRYYSYDEGEPILPGLITPYTPREFPRLVFTLLLPNMDKSVLLPIDRPRLKFPDAAEVIVGGCQIVQSKNDPLSSYLNYIDAAFVVILDKPGEVYVRIPKVPLTCPLRVPVCDNNHNCR
jgi:hypothetical protein